MKGVLVIGGLLAALAVAGAAPATAPVPGQVGALKAIRVALAAGRIDGATANAGRAEIARAAHLARTLPNGRREHVMVALEELSAFSGRLTAPRALVLIGQLKANDDYFAKHYAPAPKTDIRGDDGLVYRYFAGRCLEFHPLANFGALNALVSAKTAEQAQQLADALIARGVYQKGGGIAWEYYFNFSGGRAPWLSGMAQSVAAQAFARTAALVPDEEQALMKEAHAAYRAIPGNLLTSVPAGPWIRLYSFGSLRVLNAQLQAVISLQAYATAASDPDASALAARMQRAAAATLPKFDTGYWSYYSLPHEPSPLDYQQYVVQLLKRLAPTDPRFADAAARFASYEKQPPAFMLATGSLGALRFWLSKPASVVATTAAGPTKRLSLGGGWHTLAWPEPKRPGVYPVHLTAVDWASNRASFDALPFVRATAAKAKKTAARATADSTPAPATTTFAVGAGLDDPSLGSALQALGLRLARIGVVWPAGQTAPDPSLVAALQRLPAGLGTVLELFASPLPVDDAGRAQLAQYAAALAPQTPGLQSLVLEPAPTPDTASLYSAAFAQLLPAVQAALPGAAVGIALDGSQLPASTLAALGPITPDLVALRPAPAPAKGQWTAADAQQLKNAVAAASGFTPSVLLDGGPAPTPATIAAAACGGQLAGILLDRLGDATPAVATAAVSAQRGSFVCPGRQTEVQPTQLAFPASLALPVTVQFGCTVDCLYLVTLDGPNGKPVVAKRGELLGGAPPQAIALPAARLGAGPYRVGVRLVAAVNPGAVTQLESDPLSPN